MLYDRTGCRFVDELQPRDVVTAAIREQMKKTERILSGFLWNLWGENDPGAFSEYPPPVPGGRI